MSSIATTLRSAMRALEEETSAPSRPSTTSEMKLKIQVIKLSRGQVELKRQVADLSKDKKRLEARIQSLLRVVASHGAERDQLQLQLDAQAADMTRQVAALQQAVMVEHSRTAHAFERETALLKEQLKQAKKIQEEAFKPSSIAVATFQSPSAVYTTSLPTIKSTTSKVAATQRAAVQMPVIQPLDSTPTTPPSRKRSASSIDCVSPSQERRVRRKPSVEWTIDFDAL